MKEKRDKKRKREENENESCSNKRTPSPSPEENAKRHCFKCVSVDDSLEIKEVKIPDPGDTKVNSLLPQPPFLMTIVAPRKSGKTNLLVDSLLDTKKYKGVFDDIYIWSQSYYRDPKWKKIKIEKDKVFTTWNEGECRKVMDDVEQEAEDDPSKNFLFIFDDMIDANIMSPHRMGCVESVAVRGRHSKISIIIISQVYMKLSTPIRNNTTNLIMFRIRNSDELKKIVKENQESLTQEEFMEVYNTATNEPFHFLHINNQEPHPRLRFRKNWNTLIILSDDTLSQDKL